MVEWAKCQTKCQVRGKNISTRTQDLKRVVVTGMAANTPLGATWEQFRARVEEGRGGVVRMDEWDVYEDLNTRLAAPIPTFDKPSHWTRKQTRSMSRVSFLATDAAERALTDAGLLGDPFLQSGEVGVAFGSSTGSPEAITDFGNMLTTHSLDGITATSYIRMMAHTTPINIGVFFGLKGRVLTTSSACTSGSWGIGGAYEMIKYGKQTAMIAGGAEELCPSEAAVFDTLYATSTKNETPDTSPRPFDVNRDGLVIGEGSAALVLEARERALARGARIYGEIIGFGTNSDGGHVTQPDTQTMGVAMQLALQDADMPASRVDYVNAHGTATDRGDRAESLAMQRIFGEGIATSTLKGHIGHTLGACGAIEAWATLQMLADGWFVPTNNLTDVDPQCGKVDYIMNAGRSLAAERVMSNNFAFGGINTSLLFAPG
jgi:3-oxoacyl-[acyl-carrier-protein] synthase II